ncbi:hypothetical protein [Nocardia salmonicida]|uniref:hypothetical protein n=1 Tax=Nocardia salmonicida TaxID=53431 RepID=UPI002E299E5A|nr:hypothetical protein [Nocardia salmonicida]
MSQRPTAYDTGGVLPAFPWVTYSPEWVAYGVRWTDETGTVQVHHTFTATIAPTLAAMLRSIQTDLGALPDAAVVTRQMRGVVPIGEWVAAGPSTGPTT